MAFLASLNTHRHQLTYHSAGQGPLLLYHCATQEWESRPASTIPLSITAKIPIASPETVTFEPGDIFAVFSDGFFEYPNPEDELFGEERVMDLIKRHSGEPLEVILETLRGAIDTFAEGTEQPDDMTALLFKRVDPGDPA
jgi:phosphoserine phosphatase